MEAVTKPVAVVEWLDSFGGDASVWLSHEDADAFADDAEHMKCRSVGFLWSETPAYIVLVQSLNPYQAMYAMKIPRAAITHLTITDYALPLSCDTGQRSDIPAPRRKRRDP